MFYFVLCFHHFFFVKTRVHLTRDLDDGNIFAIRLFVLLPYTICSFRSLISPALLSSSAEVEINLLVSVSRFLLYLFLLIEFHCFSVVVSIYFSSLFFKLELISCAILMSEIFWSRSFSINSTRSI